MNVGFIITAVCFQLEEIVNNYDNSMWQLIDENVL